MPYLLSFTCHMFCSLQKNNALRMTYLIKDVQYSSHCTWVTRLCSTKFRDESIWVIVGKNVRHSYSNSGRFFCHTFLLSWRRDVTSLTHFLTGVDLASDVVLHQVSKPFGAKMINMIKIGRTPHKDFRISVWIFL